MYPPSSYSPTGWEFDRRTITSPLRSTCTTVAWQRERDFPAATHPSHPSPTLPPSYNTSIGGRHLDPRTRREQRENASIDERGKVTTPVPPQDRPQVYLTGQHTMD